MPVDENVLTCSLPQLCNIVKTYPTNEIIRCLRRLKEYETALPVDGKRIPVYRQITQDIKQNLIFYAAARSPAVGGTGKIIEELVKMKLDPTITDSNGQTALFYAAREHSIAGINLLVKLGCNVDHCDLRGQTCMNYAQLRSRVELNAVQQRQYIARQRKVMDLLLNSLGRKGEPMWQPINTADFEDRMKCPNQKRKTTLNPVFLHEFESKDQRTSFGVRYSEISDVPELVALENEFIKDHTDVMERALNGLRPPPSATCSTIGLKPIERERKRIIGSLAAVTSNGNGDARTMVAVDKKSDEVVGYMYVKSKDVRDEKILEVGNLKVKNSWARNGIASGLFVGLQSHAEMISVQGYGRRLELSVLDENVNAIKLYEHLGFKEMGEASFSTVKNWSGLRERNIHGLQVAWRRYARVDNNTIGTKRRRLE